MAGYRLFFSSALLALDTGPPLYAIRTNLSASRIALNSLTGRLSGLGHRLSRLCPPQPSSPATQSLACPWRVRSRLCSSTQPSHAAMRPPARVHHGGHVTAPAHPECNGVQYFIPPALTDLRAGLVRFAFTSSHRLCRYDADSVKAYLGGHLHVGSPVILR